MIADEQTIPLPGLDPAIVSREQFNAYLRRHNLTIRDVALAAGLRLLYDWKASRGELVEITARGRYPQSLVCPFLDVLCEEISKSQDHYIP